MGIIILSVTKIFINSSILLYVIQRTVKKIILWTDEKAFLKNVLFKPHISGKIKWGSDANFFEIIS